MYQRENVSRVIRGGLTKSEMLNYSAFNRLNLYSVFAGLVQSYVKQTLRATWRVLYFTVRKYV